MLASYIGEDDMKKSLNEYLNKFQYNNAETSDLWKCLTNVTGIDVELLMKNWIDTPGYPCVKIMWEKDHLYISQSRFFQQTDKKNFKHIVDNWVIPIEYTIKLDGVQTEHKFILDEMETDIQIDPSLLQNGWVKFNSNAVGFYRVYYDEPIRQELIKAISNNELNTIDVLRFLNDSFAFTLKGKYTFKQYFELISTIFDVYYEYDVKQLMEVYIIINEITSNIIYLMILTNEIFSQFMPFMQFMQFYEFLLNKLNGGKIIAKQNLLVDLTVNMLIKLKNANVIQQANELFGDNIPAEVRVIVLSVAVKNHFETIRTRYANLESQEERLQYIVGMSRTENEDEINTLLSMTIDNSIRPCDAIIVFSTLSLTNVGRNTAWKFIKSNWNILKEKFGDTKDDLNKLVAKTIINFTDILDIESFIESKNIKLNMEIEKIHFNKEVLYRYKKENKI
jgi:aminopeptidase N